MTSLFHIFMAQMYWIDVLTIIVICGAMALSIHGPRSRTILAKNTRYNEELTKLRKEIYNECEKNFFL